MKNKNQHLIFLHIPKAAGSTLNKILNKEYKRYEIFNMSIKEHEEFLNLSNEKRSKIKLLKGHMHFGLHKYFSHPSLYITLLRNPVDRVISYFYYVLRSPDHYLYNIVKSQNMKLEDFVCSGISVELDNGQVRNLVENAFHIDVGKCSKKLLTKAKDNLIKFFAVVGLSERIDESLILMKRELGWRGWPLYHYMNATKDRPSLNDISKNTIRMIEENNELDCELYEYAKKIFEDKWNSQNYSMKLDLLIFRTLNAFYRRYLRKGSKIYSLLINIKTFIN